MFGRLALRLGPVPVAPSGRADESERCFARKRLLVSYTPLARPSFDSLKIAPRTPRKRVSQLLHKPTIECVLQRNALLASTPSQLRHHTHTVTALQRAAHA